MEIEHVKRFGADLKSNSLGNVRVLDQAEVFVVITETSQVRNAGTAAEIKVETIRGFEGRHVEQWLAGIEISGGLRPRIRARKHPRNTAGTELRRYVAGTGAEEERWTRGHAEDAVELPSADDSVGEAAFVQEPFALSNWQFVGHCSRENVRHVILR